MLTANTEVKDMISLITSEDLSIMPANHRDIVIELSHNSHLITKLFVKDQTPTSVGNLPSNSLIQLKLTSNSN